MKFHINTHFRVLKGDNMHEHVILCFQFCYHVHLPHIFIAAQLVSHPFFKNLPVILDVP